MFKALNGIAAQVASLTISITASGDKLSVVVLPKPKTTGEGLQTPLVLTGTPEELDAEFAQLVEKYSGQYQSLEEQCESTVAILEAAKKESAAKAVEGLKKSAAPKTSPTPASGSDDGGGDDAPQVAPVVAAASAPVTVTNLFD